MSGVRTVDTLIVGASLAAAAAAKRTVDAGLETLILERQALPRHKICSGILSPRGYRFLLENFGPLPAQALHEPTYCRGVVFHFPSLIQLPMDFFGGTTPHLHRKYSDYWAIQQSGAEVMDQTSVLSVVDYDDYVEVKAREKGGETRCFRARHVIGADGPGSIVRRQIYPEYQKQIPWFFVGQKFHEIEVCPLDEEYFHFWFHPALGHYTWSHARDGRQIVGAGFKRGDNFHERHANVARYLREKHGVKLKEADPDHEGCSENFGPSLLNRYVLGKGNVLLTGQSTGFLNMIGEGMSCALHSGAISGESVIEAHKTNKPVHQHYRMMIASEVKRTTDQWNPFMIAFAKPHEADFPAALMKLPMKERIMLLRDTWNFIVLYKEFKWGRKMMRESIERLIKGKYIDRRWL